MIFFLLILVDFQYFWYINMISSILHQFKDLYLVYMIYQYDIKYLT